MHNKGSYFSACPNFAVHFSIKLMHIRLDSSVGRGRDVVAYRWDRESKLESTKCRGASGARLMYVLAPNSPVA